MDEFDAQIKSKIKGLKELVDNSNTLASTTLGALREEIYQHKGSTTTKDQPRPLVRKGRMIECYLFLQNHFMRNCPLQGKLVVSVEEEA
jgi:hypothetical protein